MNTSRRSWLKSATALSSGLLAGCHRGWHSDDRAGNVLKVFNWSDYIDPEVVVDFERLADCRVVYDNYSSDSELESRLATGAGGYDVAFPSDRAMAALIAKQALQPLDHLQLKNQRYLDRKFVRAPFDRENRFSLPYFWGTLAVGVRTDHIDGDVHGLEVLFDERHRGRVTLLDDMENVVAAVLAYLGLPLNSVDPIHLEKAKQLLIQQRPLVQAYTSDSYRERLISGEAWAALGWSGDLLQADNVLKETGRPGGRVRVIIPREGTMLWLDSMVIPKAATNVELAHRFIDYLLDPNIAVRNALLVNYGTPNTAARELLPAATLADESIYPPPEVLARCGWLENRGAEIEKIEGVWRELRQ